LQYESLTEPIEVIVHFASNGIRPIRFLWRGAAHRVETVRGKWTTLEGQRQCRHFAVTADGVGNCEIVFDLDSMIWKIESVAVMN